MTFLIAAASLGIVLLVTARVNQEITEEDWGTLFAPEARRALLSVREMWEAEEKAYESTCQLGATESITESQERVRQLLGASYQYLSALVPDRVERLRAASRYSRMVRAIAPAPPVGLDELQLKQVRRIVRLGRLAHRFLVGTRERFRLRVFLLRQMFAALLRSTRPQAGADAQAAWCRLLAAGAELRTLDHQTIESLQVLIRSSCLMAAAEELEARGPKDVATSEKAGA